jgi:hypothetical protein
VAYKDDRIMAKAWRTRLGVLTSGLALVVGLVAVGSTPALAAGHGIDVGYTVVQNGNWVGSGSFNNSDQTYGQICVRLFLETTDPQWTQELSVRCVVWPTGTGFAFSTPPYKCYNTNEIFAHVFTRVYGYDHTGRLLDSKVSNSIQGNCSGKPPGI